MKINNNTTSLSKAVKKSKIPAILKHYLSMKMIFILLDIYISMSPNKPALH